MMNRKAFVSNSLLGLSGSLILGDLKASNVPQNEEMKFTLEDLKSKHMQEIKQFESNS